MRKIFFIVRVISAVLGWVLFFYWWRVVILAGVTNRNVLISLLVIAGTLLAACLYAIAWIVHNKRVARRGRRGAVSFYVSPKFSTDALGRRLLLPEFGSGNDGRVTIVTITRGNKQFSTEKSAAKAEGR